MPNDLTGDFDVVAEFTIPVTNRVLAAMHRCERLLHSITVRVDDNPPPGSTLPPGPVIVGSVDGFGDVTINHDLVGHPKPWPGPRAATDPIYAGLGPLVNTNLVATGFDTPPVPSHLQGIAQMQLAPPTIEVPDPSGKNILLRIPVMARYFPDPNTSPVAEFIRGEVQITTAVTQVVSQKLNLNVVDVNLQSKNLSINFVADYPTNLSAEDLAGISLLIRNALRTSFLPSTEKLPDKVKFLQLSTLPGAPGAIGMLLNLGDTKGSPASMNQNFLGGGDDFALAVSREYLLAAFKPWIDNIKGKATDLYSITISQATVDLQTGQILLTIQGNASGHRWWTINFNFTVRLKFTLQANGDTVDLVAEDISEDDVDTDSWWVNHFGKGRVVAASLDARNQALAKDPNDPNSKSAYQQVNDLLSANNNIGKFLTSLVNPANAQPGITDVFILLWYNSVEIQPSGIVLRGSLQVGDWPPAHVEYEPLQAKTRPGIPNFNRQGPDYSALKTWIPGGAISQYEWSYQGQAGPPLIDPNKFVWLDPGLPTHGAVAFMGAVPGYATLCLTVRGTRLSSFGPVVPQPVSASVCGYNRFPIISGVRAAQNGALAMVALTRPGPDGLVQVVGHTPAQVDQTGLNAPNVLLHFPGPRSAGNLDVLTQALRESGREGTATAVVVVLSHDQLTKTRYTQGIIYGDSQGGAWESVFGVENTGQSMTLIVDPKGNVAWQHAGELDAATLAAALKKSLAACGPVRPSMPRLNARIAHKAPDFFIPLDLEHSLTLRKLGGESRKLVFWSSKSRPSMEAVRDLQQTTGKATEKVLAINAGETPEVAHKAAAENGLTATVVTDPQRMISDVYGVDILPTTVIVNKFGLIEAIRYGRFSGDSMTSPVGQKTPASR